MRLRVRLSRVHELGVTVLVTVANPRHRIRQSIFVAPLWRKVEPVVRSEEHTSELQSHVNLVCRLLLEKKKHCFDRLALSEQWKTLLAWGVLSGAVLFPFGVLLQTFSHFFFFNDTATPEI